MNRLLAVFFAMAALAACSKGDGGNGFPEAKLPVRITAYGDWFFYGPNGRKDALEPDTLYAILSLREASMPAAIEAMVERWSEFEADDYTPGETRYRTRIEFEPGMSKEQYVARLKEIRQAAPEAIVEPCVVTVNGFSHGVSNYFFAEGKPGVREYNFRRLTGEAGVDVIAENFQNSNVWRLRVGEGSPYGTIDVANAMYESGLFEKIEYEFLGPGIRMSEIDSKIVVSLAEDVVSRTLQLVCRTERQYPCSGWRIDSDLMFLDGWFNDAGDFVVDGEVDVSFHSVSETGFCYTAIDHARAKLNLSRVATGSHTIRLRVGGVEHAGTLTVSEESYEMELAENDAIEFEVARLNRVPRNTIWGVAENYDEAADPAIAVDAFFEELAALGVEQRPLAPGDYGYFWVDEQGRAADRPDTNLGTPSRHRVRRPFALHYEGEAARIEALLKKYGRLYIRVCSDRGDEFLSWTY